MIDLNKIEPGNIVEIGEFIPPIFYMVLQIDYKKRGKLFVKIYNLNNSKIYPSWITKKDKLIT